MLPKFQILCDPHIQNSIGIRNTGVRHRFLSSPAIIDIYASFLQKFSDAMQTAVLAHEIHHLKQDAFLRHYDEAEADLASVLASNSPCLAVYLKDFIDPIEHLPTITKENAAELLKPQSDDDPHPSHIARMSFVLTMHEYYSRARSFLLNKDLDS